MSYKEAREFLPSPEIRAGELKKRETSKLERLLARGKKWLGVVCFASLSTILVEGAFAREARADQPASSSSDASLYKKINFMAEQSGQPAPLDLVKIAGEFTNLDELKPNTPEDKAYALTPHSDALNTPGVGIAHEVASGAKIRASFDKKSEGAYALLTLKGDFFLK